MDADQLYTIAEKFGFPAAMVLFLMVRSLAPTPKSVEPTKMEIDIKMMSARIDNLVQMAQESERNLNGLRSDLREVLIEMMRGEPSYESLVKFLTINQPPTTHLRG